MRAPHVVAAALALAVGSASGEEPLIPPPHADAPPRTDAPPSVDLHGHLLATPDRVLFEAGGVRLDLRAAGGDAGFAEPFGPPQPAPHEVHAYFNVDARKASFVFRFVPAPAGEVAPHR